MPISSDVRKCLERQVSFHVFVGARPLSYISGVVGGSVRSQCVYVCVDLAARAIGEAAEILILFQCYRFQCQMVRMP
jgi:hypothetical protein